MHDNFPLVIQTRSKQRRGFLNKFLKSFYFAPQNKKGMSMWYIGNVDTAVLLHFFFWCKLRENKIVNTVIIIALHKSRL